MKTLINNTCPTITVVSDSPLFNSTTEIETITENLFLVHIKLKAAQKDYPPVCAVEWSIPAVDVHSLWHPGTDRNKAFQVDWGDGFQSKSTSLAPVASLYNLDGRNRMTFAFTDALNNVSIKAGIHEEDSTFLCSVTLFEEAMPKIDHYEATLRIDLRDISYNKALEEVTAWWETLPGYKPAEVPDVALRPMYSTWYSYHQELTAIELEEQSRLAKELGCDTIIVDDGWQTDDNNRGYAFTGDWEVYAGKIPDMKAHVDTVHKLGLKYMLWYSVPFVGKSSKVWSQFENKLLRIDEKLNAGVLDPRYPDVREYLINTYEQAIIGWDIDGLKLDFVDSFRLSPDQQEGSADGRDHESVPEAVDRLLSDVMERLRAIKPDVLIEFRQTYIGPLMRKYGNMFRANDCPNDSIQNRVRTLDLRLLSGNTAVHSDMIMFNPNEPVESAAMQLVNVIFSVPQISLRLNEIGQEYLSMLRFWLAFSREHGDVLLRGELSPQQPELLYPLVTARKDDTQITAIYADVIVPVEQDFTQLFIVNGTYSQRVVIRSTLSPARYELQVKDCCGQIISSQIVEMGRGLLEVAVPKAGLVSFKQVDAQ
ncbi:glycoside hydrolase [Bacillus sp. FJAT-27264]|uniref:glycoside hydrolase family 36 protein n=1 Tax=Paenibacillus sp. (strain DSM 101736 / FJAT-27264) TaxID=1850362 RepID=UPI000807BEAB|nr:glycoside hydrolase family 36 protein [Bacillus sp. FJAT-27264]OBZ14849.1 glycoside hydrolase [Bacillus sp. FJAT-27264]